MAETGHGGKAEAAGHGGPACYGGRQAIRRIHSSTRATACEQAGRSALAGAAH